MLARHDGLIVLVAGAIPGERVRARVERRSRSLAWARTVEVLQPSPARRSPPCDPACGGMDYVHLEYREQLQCKATIIADAFSRIGRIALPAPVPVAASPEHAYRMRARLHVRGRRAGFFREGTHDLCDAAPTRQLHPASIPAVERVLAWLGVWADRVDAVVVSENVAATERVAHVEFSAAHDGRATPTNIEPPDGVTGVTTEASGRRRCLVGTDVVTDLARDLWGPLAPVPESTRWTRSSTSFFQGNRYLVGDLVRHVLACVRGDRVVDLYAGVGLFAVAAAAAGFDVTAIEGEASAAADLTVNAGPWPRLRCVHAAVEAALDRTAPVDGGTIILDPPRTGATSAAIDGVIRLRASRIVYVSCDPPTLGRDAARLLTAGYRIADVRAFDLFPNTSHVETVVVFDT